MLKTTGFPSAPLTYLKPRSCASDFTSSRHISSATPQSPRFACAPALLPHHNTLKRRLLTSLFTSHDPPKLISKSTSTHQTTMDYQHQQQPGYGPPQPGYGPPPQQPMAYQQAPPPPPEEPKKSRGCLTACLATLCCCWLCGEACECCLDCLECCDCC
ncbi:hypothetical protein ACJQWK_03529 [Exserohilum turcicum]